MSLGKILIVDDDKINIKLLNTILTKLDYSVIEAFSATQALELIEQNRDIDLVITDLMMPEIDGYELTAKIKQKPEFATIPIIMLTSLGQRKDKIKALEVGVDDFLNKPVDKTELTLRIKGFMKVKKYNDQLYSEKENLEKELTQKESKLVQTLDELKNISEDKSFLVQLLEEESMKLLNAYRELKSTNEKIKSSNLQVIQALSSAAEFRDNETGMHIKRMSNYSALIAKKIGLSQEECDDILYTSAMHDVGKIGIPDHILLKPASLSDEEWKIMKTHAFIGYKVLSRINTDMMKKAAILAYTHHEKWDGSGYPRGLSGEDIPLEGRICAIADVFDALTSKRVYKPEFPIEKAVEILKEGRGNHFDPKLIDIFLDSMDEILAIKEKYQETDEDFEKQKELVELYKSNVEQ